MSPGSPYQLAVFPLEQVVLPGATVSLHIFEPRYRSLARELALHPDPEFGITTILRGREVGGGEQRADVGVAAQVVASEELSDGRWQLAAVGTRRIRVTEWLADDPYPRAMVDDWPDRLDGTSADDHLRRFAELAEVHLELIDTLRRLDPRSDARRSELHPDPTRATWQILADAQLGALDNLKVLSCPTLIDRLSVATELLAERRDLLDALSRRDR